MPRRAARETRKRQKRADAFAESMAKYTPEFIAKLTLVAMLCECGIDLAEAKALAEDISHAAPPST
jgi:hypothetical protein